MSNFPQDIYTEPKDVDVHTLRNLGPLTGMAGIWQGERGLDVKPKAEGPKKQAFVERIELHLELPASAHMPALAGTVALSARGCEPQVVSIPFGNNRGMYSHKACLVPEGELRLGDEVLSFSPAEPGLARAHGASPTPEPARSAQIPTSAR